MTRSIDRRENTIALNRHLRKLAGVPEEIMENQIARERTAHSQKARQIQFIENTCERSKSSKEMC